MLEEGNNSPNNRPLPAFDAWLDTRRFALLLALLIVAAFPQIVFGFHSFAYRDYGLFGYPIAHYHRDCFWRGEIPLWNPYNNFGIPFLAQWNTMTLYPGSLIYLLLPLPWSLGIFCLVHVWLGGMGMYMLGWKWSGSRLAGGFAGIGFAFSGLALSFLMWPNYTASLGWMPWVIWAVHRAWVEGGKQLFIASLLGALQMLSGGPEVILFTWLLLPGLWLCQRFTTWKEVLTRAVRFAVILALVAALTAPQMLPFVELLSQSHRDSGFDLGHWSLPIWVWANFFVPMFRVFGTGCGVHFQYAQVWTSSTYSGLFLMLSGLLALCWWRDRRVWILAAAVMVGVILGMGQNSSVYKWLREAFPQIGFMRYNAKFIIMPTFAWPVLGAFGISALLRSSRSRRLCLSFGLAVIFTVVIAGIVTYSRLNPFPQEDWSRTLSNGATRALLLVVIVAGVNMLMQVQHWKRQLLLQGLVLLVFWLDCNSHVPQQNPSVDRSTMTVDLPAADAMSSRPRLGESRALLTLAAMEQYRFAGTSNLTHTCLILRNGLYANANLVPKIAKVDGFYALYLQHEWDIQRNLFRSNHKPHASLARFAGVAQMTSPTNYLAWEAGQDFLPFVTAGQQPIFAEAKETLSALIATNFNPQATVYLPKAAQSAISATNTSLVSVRTSQVRAHRIEAEVSAGSPALVVFAQAHYWPWRAMVDGQPAQIWRANHAFQAIEVGPGNHHITLVYRDRTFYFGLFLSAVGLVGCALGLCRSRTHTAIVSFRDTRAEAMGLSAPITPELPIWKRTAESKKLAS